MARTTRDDRQSFPRDRPSLLGDAGGATRARCAQAVMTPVPTATVLVPYMLREYCGGAAELPVAAGTVREALGILEMGHPGLYRSICDETGAVRRHVNVFVNSHHVRDRNGLDTALASGDA